MKVCVDTNVLLQARAISHPFSVILDAFVFGRMQWVISNSIVNEYQEIISQRCGPVAWTSMSLLLQNLETRSIIERVIPHFQFQVVIDDPDDNNFTDCAIAAHADYVITEDKHFEPLRNAGYKPQPITPAEFIAKYRGVCV